MSTIKYLDIFPSLPSTSPDGNPHVIDMSPTPRLLHSAPLPSALSLQDTIVTILYHHDPDSQKTLNAFLNLWTDFKFHVHEPPGGAYLDFVIEHVGKTVNVGFLNELGVPGWDTEIVLRIGMAPADPWTVKSYDDAMGVLYDREEAVEGACRRFAFAALSRRVWEGGKGGRVEVGVFDDDA